MVRVVELLVNDIDVGRFVSVSSHGLVKTLARQVTAGG
jgi:hypothetical protein